MELGTADGRASMRGVQRCGSVWACPVCAPKIRNGRASEISEGVGEHLRRGGGVVFVTLTVPHDRGDRLGDLWDSVAGVWRQVTASGAWKALGASHGLLLDGRRKLGVIRALESTVGPNGWHPHLHVLVLTDAPLAGAARELLCSEVERLWCDRIEAEGWRRPLPGVGVVCEDVTSSGALGQYVAGVDGTKIDLELARGDLKRGRGVHRSPFQVLADLTALADRDDLVVWWEFERASKGRRFVTWTAGLKAHLGVGEATDDDLAAAEVGHRTVLELHGDAWSAVCRAKLAAPLLSAVENYDEADALAVLVLAGVSLSFCVWHGPPD